MPVSIIQSTTTGTTICAPYHCLHTKTYSVPVDPIRKLLKYSCRQGHGNTNCHLAIVTHRIICTIPFCISACTLHMTPIWVVCLLSRASLSCTMYSLYHVPRFNTLLYCTLRPSCHECCTSTYNSRTMQLLTLHRLRQWQSNVPP